MTSGAAGPLLLLEDDPDIGETLCEVLGEAGYQVEWAHDGAAGLALLDNGFIPAVVVLDLMMPRMGGAEFLERLRARPAGGDIPVLVTSAFESAPDLANGSLRKPFSLPDLLAALRALPPAR